MGYLFVIAILASLFAGGYGTYQWEEGKYARLEKKQHDAEAMIEAQSDAAIDTAEKTIEEKKQAFADGEANAKTVEKKVYIRLAGDESKYPVFQNPVCTTPPQSFALLVAALKGTRTGITIPAEAAIQAMPPAPTVVAPAPVAPTSAKPSAHPKPVPIQKGAP